MSYTIEIKNLSQVRALLGKDFQPAVTVALKGIMDEVEDKLTPYGAYGIWNSPQNPTGRWYERGYGPHWWVSGQVGLSANYEFKSKTRRRAEVLRLRKKGVVHGEKTSENLQTSWHREQLGPMKIRLYSKASYAYRLHMAGHQVAWAKRRGWVTDEDAIKVVVWSGRANKILTAAIMAKLWKR